MKHDLTKYKVACPDKKTAKRFKRDVQLGMDKNGVLLYKPSFLITHAFEHLTKDKLQNLISLHDATYSTT